MEPLIAVSILFVAFSTGSLVTFLIQCPFHKVLRLHISFLKDQLNMKDHLIAVLEQELRDNNCE